MTSKDATKPAFPIVAYSNVFSSGMTLRQYTARKMAEGMLAHGTRYRPRAQDSHLHWHAALVKEAYEIADAFEAHEAT